MDNKIIEEFDKNVKELKDDNSFNNIGETKTHLFGCRYKDKNNYIFTIVDFGNIKKFINKAFAQQKQDIIEEMIKLSDTIESQYETPDINEWRAFKHFRNTMRDKIKKL